MTPLVPLTLLPGSPANLSVECRECLWRVCDQCQRGVSPAPVRDPWQRYGSVAGFQTRLSVTKPNLRD